jgi:hypothetical protein
VKMWHIITWLQKSISICSANDTKIWSRYINCTEPHDPDYLHVMLF